PNATEIAIAELLQAVLAHFDPSKTVLWSDEHKAYPRAIRRIGAASIPHKTVSSKAIRDAKNPLFPINLADMLIRHTQSNQKRETIAFSKRRQGGLDRAWLWAAERNYVLPRRIKRGDPPPAVQLGLVDRALRHEDVFSRRIFDFEVEIPEVWRRHIRRDVVTRVFSRNRRYRLKYGA
ncbi:MAG TPA: hypothetical protein VMV18_15425, partial [bacterium]|nr:hypothetical protein [bacterium]